MPAKSSQANKKQRKTKNRWFTSVRGSYLPASGAGWLTYIPFIAYLVLSLVVGTRDISSAWVAIFFIVPNWIAAAAVMTWFAARKS